MQITISEFEIKSAIRTFIHDQIKINPGMKIEIDLKATRGAEGATAIIDIVPDAQVGQMTVTALQEPKKKEVAEVAHESKTASVKIFAPATPIPVEVVMPVDNPTTVIPVGEAIAPLPEVTAESPVHVPDAEVPVPARTSLFAGLRKPVNP